MKSKFLLLNVLAFGLLGFPEPADSDTIVAVDATGLGLADGLPVSTIANGGTAGDFTTLIGDAETVSHPANDNPAVSIQGLGFDGAKMVSANTQASTGLTENAAYTVRAWVWNEQFGNEEAHLSWGHRGGPLGSNAGFHQGVHPTFGAIGHWGGGSVDDPNEPDVGWGPHGDGSDILDTEGRWANLAYVYDGTTDFVYIDGVLNNSEEHPNGLDFHTTFDDGSDTFIVLGSESDAANNDSTPIAFSGTIARTEVFDTAMTEAEILSSFEAESPLFFDGIPEPKAIVDVDATALGLADGVAVTTIANPGSAGDFSTHLGEVVVAGHPANNNQAVSIKGLGFDQDKMTSTNTQASTGLTENAAYTVRAWVWNEQFGNEEAHLSWGHRGGPLGSNAGFHQGVHPTFGAIGHWGGGSVDDPNEPDVGWGPHGDGSDILDTEGRWANLAYVYDGTTDFVYIDGVLNNSEEHPNGLDFHTTFDDGSDTFIVLGSESDAANNDSTPIPFSGTVARVQVLDAPMTDEEIQDAFNTESPLFFDGVSDVSDTDGDGIPNEIEDKHACLDSTVADADADPDEDDLSNQDEVGLGTDPCDDDSDDDNVKDGAEVNRMAGGQPAPTNPNHPDTDDDGLKDDVETNTGINNGPDDTGTDPLVADGDDDGLSDGQEIEAETDPFDDDSDDDGWNDGIEVSLGTNPNDNTSVPEVSEITVVDVDATELGLTDGDEINSLTNIGTAGEFTTLLGSVVASSHPSNNNPDVMIQGAGFDGAKMVSANTQASTGLTENAAYTVRAWVWNEQFGNEEAHVSWGHRGGPLGSNAGFHQGVHPTFGAIGHWGGGPVDNPNEPDVGWGPHGDGSDILETEARWANLAYVYDGTTDFVYIDGALNNSEEHPNGLDFHTTFNDGSDTFIVLGSESDAANNDSTPIPFSGTIARAQVFDVPLGEAEILTRFEEESPLFFEGIPDAPDGSFQITAIVYEQSTDQFTISWNIGEGSTYSLQYSQDFIDWGTEITDGIDPGDPDADPLANFDLENEIVTYGPFENPVPGAKTLGFRAQQN